MEQTRTELHTHLMGMLSAREFIQLINDYSDIIYWPVDREQDENSIIIDSSSLFNNKEAIEAISIPLGETRPYKEGLGSIYRNRSDILSFVVRNYAYNSNISEKEAQLIIYNDYFNRALEELIDYGVKYTEISFANEGLISSFVQDKDTLDKIKVNFLLCTQRANKIGPAFQERINKACATGLSIGFDIMGLELPMEERELRKTGKESFYRKLEPLLRILTQYDNSVLRIHSGESVGSEENTEHIFRMIDELKSEYGYPDFPPPELRIGHGVHYNKNDYFYNFLRKNHVIIEINGISNRALSNINSINELPYIDYLKHGIPIVLSTDAHGAYSTCTYIEDVLALKVFVKNHFEKGYELVKEIDDAILERKTRG